MNKLIEAIKNIIEDEQLVQDNESDTSYMNYIIAFRVMHAIRCVQQEVQEIPDFDDMDDVHELQSIISSEGR